MAQPIQWTPMSSMTKERYGTAGVEINNEEIIVMGGHGDNDTAEIYNVETEAWNVFIKCNPYSLISDWILFVLFVYYFVGNIL